MWTIGYIYYRNYGSHYRFAEDLHKKAGTDYPLFIDARDKNINTLGNTLLHFKGTLRLTLWLIHLFEWKNPVRIITALHEYKKKFIKVSNAKNLSSDLRP